MTAKNKKKQEQKQKRKPAIPYVRIGKSKKDVQQQADRKEKANYYSERKI